MPVFNADVLATDEMGTEKHWFVGISVHIKLEYSRLVSFY
jgi:hypothetical protein